MKIKYKGKTTINTFAPIFINNKKYNVIDDYSNKNGCYIILLNDTERYVIDINKKSSEWEIINE